MSRRKRGRGLGAPTEYHAQRVREATMFAKNWIKGAVRDARAGKCHVAIASSENALVFAAQAQAHKESETGERLHQIPILKRALSVSTAVVRHCLARSRFKEGSAKKQGQLFGPRRRRKRKR